MSHHFSVHVLLALAFATPLACSDGSRGTAAPPAAAGPPAAAVKIQTVDAKPVERASELIATVKSLNPTFQVSVGPAILSQDRRITRDQVGARDGLDYLAKAIAAYRAEYGQPIPADYFAATGHVIRADHANFHAWQARLVDLRRILADAGLRDRRVMLTESGVPLRGSTYADIATFGSSRAVGAGLLDLLAGRMG